MGEAEAKKILVDWLVKINILKDQIEKLEKLKNFPIIAISAFLLKSQIIEFELKQFIFSMDLHLSLQNKSKLLGKKVRSPKDLEELTLGKLKREIDQFEGERLKELKTNLGYLVGKRNEFTHKLFSQGKDVIKLNKEAEEGIKIANKILRILERLEKVISKHER